MNTLVSRSSAVKRRRKERTSTDASGQRTELALIPPDELRMERVRLGPLAAALAPVHCVPAGWWQAARSMGEYTLVGCAVGPGFDFGDFEMMKDQPRLASEIAAADHGTAEFI